MISMVALVVVLVVTARFDVVKYALAALIPMAIGAVTMISRRVVAMFNFTLAESPRGLRITRGLTNLTSQSVPINRIQGLKITPIPAVEATGSLPGRHRHPRLRPIRAARTTRSSATSVLLPVATAAEVALAISRVLPGIDLARSSCFPPRDGPDGCAGSTSGPCATAGTTRS